MKDFEQCVEFVLAREGGYVNDPSDSGRETNFGISKKYFPDLDIKNLTRESAKQIYFTNYWKPTGCEAIRWPLNLLVFDTAVNMGNQRAVKYFSLSRGDVEAFLNLREARYRKLARVYPKNERFLKGWLNRLNEIRKEIKK